MSLKNNLYSVRAYIVNYDEGDRSIERNTISFGKSIDDRFHTVLEGDLLTDLAFIYYGDPVLWYIIADANNIFNPFDDLTPGMNLRIPPAEPIASVSN